MALMNEPDVVIRHEDDFATVTMNRPQRRNALSLTMLQSLRAAFEQVGNSDARGVVLAGNGPVFSAGHDFAGPPLSGRPRSSDANPSSSTSAAYRGSRPRRAAW